MSTMKALKKSVKAAYDKADEDRKSNADELEALGETRLQAALAELPATIYAASLTRGPAIVMKLNPEDTIMPKEYRGVLQKKDLKCAGVRMYKICKQLGLYTYACTAGEDNRPCIVVHMGYGVK